MVPPNQAEFRCHTLGSLYSFLLWGRVVLMLSTKVKVKVNVKSLSRVQLFATRWTVARQAPLSMGLGK